MSAQSAAASAQSRVEREQGDPYRDVLLSVEYTGPDGSVTPFWGFYDGDGTWRLRFNSDAVVYDPTFSNYPSGDALAQPLPYDGMPYSVDLRIAPYTALVLSQ